MVRRRVRRRPSVVEPMKWLHVTADEPGAFKTVLTIHQDDLYPVAAFQIEPGVWQREVEGPEDIFVNGSGRYGALYRPPTHWMPLPDGPLVQAEDAEANRG